MTDMPFPLYAPGLHDVSITHAALVSRLLICFRKQQYISTLICQKQSIRHVHSMQAAENSIQRLTKSVPAFALLKVDMINQLVYASYY